MGDAERIGGHAHAADQQDDRQAVPDRQPADEDRGDGGGKGDEGHAGDDLPPVEAVGKPAQRILEQNAAQKDRAAVEGDLGDREADALGIDRRHAPERALRDADAEAADHPQGRNAVQLAQADRRRRSEVRRRGGGQQDRDQRQGDQDRGRGEQLETGRVGQVQQELAAADPAEHDHHVGGQNLPPGLVGRPVVQPALGHHVEAGAAEAGQEAHGDPGPGLDHHGMGQDRRRGERGQGGEDPDVADLLQQLRRGDRADQEAGEVGRHHQAGHGRREVLDGGAHAEQGALQSAAEHDQGDAQEQGPGRPQGRGHIGLQPKTAPGGTHPVGRRRLYEAQTKRLPESRMQKRIIRGERLPNSRPIYCRTI